MSIPLFFFGLCSFIVTLGSAYRILRTKKKETHRQKESQFVSENTNKQRQKKHKMRKTCLLGREMEE